MLEKINQKRQSWTRLTPNNAFYDRTLFWLMLTLLMIGFVIVTSASIAKEKDDPFYYAIRDGVSILISLVVFFTCLGISLAQWEKHNVALFFFSLLLLALTLFIGREINGAKRWLPLVIMNFQPAELAKFALICFLSGFYVRRYHEIKSKTISFLKPILVISLYGVILLLQPDLGSFVVLFVLAFATLFIAGARLFQFFLLGGVGTLLIGFFVMFSEYRMKRLISYQDPFADFYGAGNQLANSLIAFGHGGLFGQGLGNSVQKLGFLPEPHTDFVMAILGEEFGLLGVICVILLLALLTYKAIRISQQSLQLEQRFKGFFAFGIGILIFFQGFVNLGMTLGLLPTKGLTFPLISYGGSSLMMMSVAIAVLIRIDHENRLERAGQAHRKADT